jgi:hypothetical protein
LARLSTENERGCYCDLWEKDPAQFEDEGVPRGYCGLCETCGRPGHTRHFPGNSPSTGCWCDSHFRLISFIHPLGYRAKPLYLGVAALGFIVWWVLR